MRVSDGGAFGATFEDEFDGFAHEARACFRLLRFSGCGHPDTVLFAVCLKDVEGSMKEVRDRVTTA